MIIYNIQYQFELQESDFVVRYDFSRPILGQMEIEIRCFSCILGTDETHFSLNCEINTQDCRIWSTENPYEIVQECFHKIKVISWCGFTVYFIISKYFFKKIKQGKAVSVTVNRERYIQMLRDRQNYKHDNICIPTHLPTS